jgi:hypothetical protein
MRHWLAQTLVIAAMDCVPPSGSQRSAQYRVNRIERHQLPKVILGVKFTDGIELVRSQSLNRCPLIPSVTNIRR